MTPTLALVLVHDLLLSKGGIATAAVHPLRIATEKNKTRLNAELTRARIRRQLPTLDAFRAHVNARTGPTGFGLEDALLPRPRWVRVNTLKTTTEKQLKTTFATFTSIADLGEFLSKSRNTDMVLHVDQHIPDLLALPLNVDVSKYPAYQKGEIIFQDKASCFPAYLLDPHVCKGDIVDACAAPGNKTSQLAALLSNVSPGPECSRRQKVYAVEKDKGRGVTLRKMLALAGAQEAVFVEAARDFLTLDPEDAIWSHISGLLLDPSCSGSGIVGRGDVPELVLPGKISESFSRKASKSQKSARNDTNGIEDTIIEEDTRLSGDQGKRLSALSSFQTKLLTHAFRFPSADRITYSTCSVHPQENEHVVMAALASDIARRADWRILRREEQVAGAMKWEVRGDYDACLRISTDREDAQTIAKACIRCNKTDGRGTMGFFVAGFVRAQQTPSRRGPVPDERVDKLRTDDLEAEWVGFDPGDDGRSRATLDVIKSTDDDGRSHATLDVIKSTDDVAFRSRKRRKRR